MPSIKQEPYDQPGLLMRRTVELLRERNLLKVYEDTKIPFYWLRKFSSGETKNPSVNRVQYLYEFLSGKSIL